MIQRRVGELREDYEALRKEQQSEMAEFSLGLRGTSYKIMAAIRGHARIAGEYYISMMLLYMYIDATHPTLL